jgi:pimeloyl-ACP methyl ester carboxylesterase
MVMVQGVSGGGPYALACAFALPNEKLKAVSIVCGLGPVSEIGMKGARWLNWIGFTFGYHYTPRILNRWFWQSQTCGRLDWSDEKRLERHMKDFPKPKSTADEKDFEVMTNEDNARRFLRTTRESFAQGYDAALQDGRVLSKAFGFRIEDIRPVLPVQLWYGKLDVFVPLNHGETIAKRLGDRANLRVEDETHASIFFKWREQILEDLVKRI